jgi:hypothetical protein
MAESKWGAGQTGGRPLLEKREKWRTPQLFRSLLNRQPGLYSAEMWPTRLSSLEAQHRNLLPICPHRSVLKSFAGQISSSPEFSV